MIINPHKKGYDPQGLLIGSQKEPDTTFQEKFNKSISWNPSRPLIFDSDLNQKEPTPVNQRRQQ